MDPLKNILNPRRDKDVFSLVRILKQNSDNLKMEGVYKESIRMSGLFVVEDISIVDYEFIVVLAICPSVANSTVIENSGVKIVGLRALIHIINYMCCAVKYFKARARFNSVKFVVKHEDMFWSFTTEKAHLMKISVGIKNGIDNDDKDALNKSIKYWNENTYKQFSKFDDDLKVC